MTTVNEAKVKVNGEWVSLVPDATTSSKGIVKVGDGLEVSDGTISVAGAKLKVNQTSRTNSGGFLVGTYSYTLPGASGTASLSQSQSQTVIQSFLPNTPVRTPYNEFAVTDSAMDYAIQTFTITATIVISRTLSGSGSTVNVNVYRTSNSESLGSGSWGSLYTNVTYTETLDVTLPRDWQWGTDTLYVVVSDSSYHSSSSTTCTITAGTASGSVYFVPTTS